MRFLDAQAELGMTCNAAWGLFVARSWPVPFEDIISTDYAVELRRLKDELSAMRLPEREAQRKTLAALDGTLGDIAAVSDPLPKPNEH